MTYTVEIPNISHMTSRVELWASNYQTLIDWLIDWQM